MNKFLRTMIGELVKQAESDSGADLAEVFEPNESRVQMMGKAPASKKKAKDKGSNFPRKETPDSHAPTAPDAPTP